jgi:hypothetical protein
MDGFSMIDNTSTTVADTTPPSSSISCNGASCSSGAYGGAVSVSLSATDNAGGSGVSQIVYTTDGTDPTPANGSAFSAPFAVAQSSTVRFRAYDKAGNAEAVHAQAIQVDTVPPTVSLSAPATGATLAGTATLSATAADNLALRQVDFLVDGQVVASDNASPYTASWNSTSVGNSAHSVAARAVDTAGNQATSAPATVTVSNGSGTYYGTAPSGNAVGRLGPSTPTGFPRDAATCAATIIRSSWEPRADNAAANNTKGDGSYVWGPDATDTYWAAFRANVLLAQGQFTGTTTEMFSWAACRWGIDENILRAVGVQESHWHQSSWGDRCAGTDPTIGSFGIIQIKNKYCDGSLSEGGMPDTGNSTALALDFYGAKIRSCYDGDFYGGGGWLYGQTVGQIAAANGWDYVLWGCIGYWYSGGWYDSGAQSYINSVKGYLANRTWLTF